DAVGYMAPELGAATGNQASPATPASDLYALGVVLYRMLAGRAPFDGSSLVAVAMRHRNDAPLPPSRFNPNCPADLEELALRLLQKNPQHRPASAAEVLQVLNGTSNGIEALSAPATNLDNAPVDTPATPVSATPVSTIVTPDVAPDVAPGTDGAKTEPLPSSQSQEDALSNADAKTELLPPSSPWSHAAELSNMDTKTQPLPSPSWESQANASFQTDTKTQPLPASSTPSDTSSYHVGTGTEATPTTLIDISQNVASSTRTPLPNVGMGTSHDSSANAFAAVSSAASAAPIPAAVVLPAAAAVATAPILASATATSAAATVSTASALTTNAPLGQSVQAAKVPSTAGVVAGTGSVSPPPSLPPTDDDLAADKEIERKARRKHRRREAWSAVRAFLWVWVAVGLLGGMVYGSYRWWVNSAPRDVKVPSYIGKNEGEVKELLRKAGLKYAVQGEVYDPRRSAGTVLRGFPAPGKTVKLGRIVSVTVSRGAERVLMPDLSELTLPQVRQVLQRAGMRLGNISAMYHDTVARGYICGQYPSPGDSFSRSDSINLIISRGPQPTESPASQLPPPPEPPDTQPPAPGNSSTDQGGSSTGGAPDAQMANPFSSESGSDADTPQVSRTVLIRIPVPPKSGASSREVRVVVRDADGEHTVYEQSHAPGELVDEYVQITRAQGGSATILIYIDDVLQKQQRV
ncbi:MAG TPA: PASTA domain-containing protein, partial [Abditibacteriaceae bacterium]|nr:PASTA domain-containing protein [Abditibacteriaceae bacterium]